MEVKQKQTSKKKTFEFKNLPKINLSHIDNLTDDTGIIQHAIFNVPNRKEGYCIDDNARALLLSVMAHKFKPDKHVMQMMQVYLSFVHYMQTDKGEFKNFMSYAKVTAEEKGSEDSFGRTIMALGFLINEGPSNLFSKTASGIFAKAYHNIDKLVSVRGIANAMIGVCQYVKYNYPDDSKQDMVIKLADKLVNMYKENSDADWHWFEGILAYDNAILPLALLNAYEITNDETYLNTALEAMEFLESKVFHDDILSPIGNNGWCKKGKKTFAKFDQQGIDAMAMVLFYQQAYRITSDKDWLSKMYTSYQWFTGKNDLGLSLYDPLTGGCADGIHSTEINLNQGAESTIAYWISHFIVAFELQA